MAIKDMIGAGIGFDPGSILYIFTRGLDIGVVLCRKPARSGPCWCGANSVPSPYRLKAVPCW
jgi:hypothetical protein